MAINMAKQQNSIEKRLALIEARNRRVEDDKAWETSLTRKFAIALLTYFVIVLYLQFVVHINPWLNALVPVMGYLLSTLVIQKAKEAWMKRRH